MTGDSRTFKDYFAEATGFEPFPYQTKFACNQHLPEMIDVPTGAGKTATVVLGWLWRRRFGEGVTDKNGVKISAEDIRKNTPRRLVYCLPMRVLVDQTVDNVVLWLQKLGMLAGKTVIENGKLVYYGHCNGQGATQDDDRSVDGYAKENGDQQNRIAVTTLMAGEETDEWDIYPERDAIIIGTQDMLLSRALNRGYGMSRYQWPAHFGLLNNDCLWVMDEVQLMGNGLGTTVQNNLFHMKIWKTVGHCLFLWMSATSDKEMFVTRDRKDNGMVQLPACHILSLSTQELHSLPSVLAEKTVVILNGKPRISSSKTRPGIMDNHQPGTLSLVIVNTVTSAQSLFQEFRDFIQEQVTRKRQDAVPKVVLIHGRMRPYDRQKCIKDILEFDQKQRKTGNVLNHPGMILIATQVVEAGLDISVRRLWSEIAPWPSVIQRLGRLNRQGEQRDAQGNQDARAWFWMPKTDKEDANSIESPNAGRIGPYERDTLKKSKELLESLQNIRSPSAFPDAFLTLQKQRNSEEALKISYEDVIRPQDFHELFSTEPDLAGGFTDVSRYVRNVDRDADVQVFWADFKDHPPGDKLVASHEILCNVSVHALTTFIKENKTVVGWEWDREAGKYQIIRADDVCPGMTLLLPRTAGGYIEDLGWTGKPAHHPSSGLAERFSQESFFDDRWSEGDWMNLEDHLKVTKTKAENLVDHFDLGAAYKNAVIKAALWHDVGKLHPRWQDEIKNLHDRLLNKIKTEKLPDGLATGIEPLLGGNFPTSPQAKFPPWIAKINKYISRFKVSNSDDLKLLRKKLNVRFNPKLRHEAASALVAWQYWLRGEAEMTALAVYLIASHHGKVRTVLRSTKGTDDVFGILSGDELPCLLGWFSEPIYMDLNLKAFGLLGNWVSNDTYDPTTPSWVGVTSELLGKALHGDTDIIGCIPNGEPKDIGPFVLAFLEALVIAADRRASKSARLWE